MIMQLRRGSRLLSRVVIQFNFCIRNMMQSAVAHDDPRYLHLFDGGVTNVYSAEIDNLSVGAPGPDLLKRCVEIFRKSTIHRMDKEKDNPYLFQYGIPCGLWDFREILSHFLTKHYGDKVNRKDLVLTCGASHGIQLIMGLFLPPNAVIFVEEVTYMIALSTFQQYPLMKVIPVPMGKDGINIEEFRKIVHHEKSKGKWTTNEQRPFWSMLYTIPIFHNPTGTTMPDQSCRALVKIAQELDILIVCDDVYNLLYYGAEKYPPKRLFAYDREDSETDNYKGGHVISNCSFSKILAPGVRVGWLESPPRLTNMLRESGGLVSGGGVNQYMAGVITSAIELNLAEDHLIYLVNTFKDRIASLCDVLEKNLPKGCNLKRPEGGYFVWIVLPETIDADDFIPWCAKNYKVTALSGSVFSPVRSFKNCIRIAISFHNSDKLKDAGYKMCQALSTYLEERNQLCRRPLD